MQESLMESWRCVDISCDDYSSLGVAGWRLDSSRIYRIHINPGCY
jgi:hypothetical protein